MRKTVKILACATAVSLIGCVAVGISSCGGAYKSVSTVDELYAMQSNKSYKLTCDIDLQNRAWTPLTVKYFDGNGYSISNCNINATLASDGGFFSRVEKLNNVTFKGITGNISLSAEQSINGGIAAGLVHKEMKNVTVTDCEMSFMATGSGSTLINVGGIAGEYRAGTSYASTGFTGVFDCKLENSSVSVVSKNCALSAGGIVGSHWSKELNDCVVVNSSLKSSNGGTFGGIVGKVEGGSDSCAINNCVFEKSSIETGGAWVGGIMGALSQYAKVTLSQCAALDGTISDSGKGGYSAGGLVGFGREAKITDCLAGGMTITCKTTSTDADAVCRVGGLCGSIDGTVAKCIVYGSKVSGTNSTKSKNMTACGLTAKVGGSVNACAVYGVDVSGGKTDIFCPESNTVFNCFVGSGSAQNVNNIPVLDESGWSNILNELRLDYGIWDFADGKPVLKNTVV